MRLEEDESTPAEAGAYERLKQSDWDAMSKEQKDDLSHRLLHPSGEYRPDDCVSTYDVKFGPNVVRVKPDWVGRLYNSFNFPTFETEKGESCSMNPEDLFQGVLRYNGERGEKYCMAWKGYHSLFHDGQLQLVPMIEGADIVCDLVRKDGTRSPAFRFSKHVPESGIWPGFLLVHANPRLSH